MKVLEKTEICFSAPEGQHGRSDFRVVWMTCRNPTMQCLLGSWI